jgi:quercetin dioxygenase-like cupin family protein
MLDLCRLIFAIASDLLRSRVALEAEILVLRPQINVLRRASPKRLRRDWVSQSKDVAFKPLILNVTQGYYVNILRVRASGVLSRHRHSGPVHAIALPGRWRYLEHDWVASAGDYAFEPPGATHTLVVPDDVKEMATLFDLT